MKKIMYVRVEYLPNSDCYGASSECFDCEESETWFSNDLSDSEVIHEYVENATDNFESEGFSWNDWDVSKHWFFLGLDWEGAEVLCCHGKPIEIYYVQDEEDEEGDLA